MDARVKQLSDYWMNSKVFDAATRQEIKNLADTQQVKELNNRFYKDLEFGTGGLRGVLGAGSAYMNIYNVRKASHALALQVKESFASSEKELKIAVSYDSRKYSPEFAKASAEVFAAHGIKTLITKELRPVPMLSYLVRSRSCQAGVCITASHNPPNYNGYKAYWNDGAQITPPIDKKIINRYLGIESYEDIPFISYENALSKNLVEEISSDLDEAYFSEVKNLSLHPEIAKNNFKIVYTPLHGSGAYPVKKVLESFGFSNITIVPEQEKPDGNFPTVAFPNPEEADALKMAVDLAKKMNADIVLATDPDADRIGIVVNESGNFVFLNGNQIACLLVEYTLSSLKQRNELPENALVIKTIVTTELQRKITEHYKASCEETLTGFKWICGLIQSYESGEKKPYKKYICGGEESFGFLRGSFVRDKDGVSSCAIAAEMVAYYKSIGKNLSDVLNDIYRRHGVYSELLHTITLPGQDGATKIKSMMHKLRENPPIEIAGIHLSEIRDYELGTHKKYSNNAWMELGRLDLPKSDVLQFELIDGTKISVRPSGTEPKIKFYISARENIDPDVITSELEDVKIRCKQKTEDIKNFMVRLANA